MSRFSVDAASALEELSKNPKFKKVDPTKLADAVAAIMEANEAYMADCGIGEKGGYYDDDEAYDTIVDKVSARPEFAKDDMLIAELADAFMDINEDYLTALGLIEWE